MRSARLLAGALALLLTGCAGPVQTVVQEVPVPVPEPVAVPCNAPDVPQPSLPIDALGPEATIFDHVKALWATDEVRESYEVQLRAALDSCRGPR